jgi:ribonuclease P protein component
MRNIEALKKNEDFREVYKKGNYAENELLILRALNKKSDITKIGISVSKKVGNSVVRHRTIRLIRESYLMVKEQLVPGYNIVVIAKPEAKEKGLAEISGAFLQLLIKKKLVQ